MVQVQGTNPSPVITSLYPASAVAGSSGFTLGINGNNFFNGAVVQWNGSSRATTYFGAYLTIELTTADLSTAGSANVTVINPAPGGGVSNTQTFTISNTTSSPNVTTTTAGDLTSISATLNGSINPNGGNTIAWFEWGIDGTLSSYNTTASQAMGSGNTDVGVYFNLNGLSSNSVYYFRVAASNPSGTSRGAIQSFTTQSGAGSSGCSDYALETTIANLTQPIWLGVSGSKLFSTSVGKVQVIDLSSNTLSASIPFSPYPNAYGGGIAFLNGKAYMPLGNLGTQAQVAIIDTATNTVTGYIPVGAEPYAIAAYNGKLYVTHSVQWSNGTPSTVDVIDPNSNSVTASINAGVNTQDIAIVPSLNRGYAVNYVSATATIMDLGTNTVSGTISLPINPRSAVFAAGKIYIAGALINSQYGQVIVIDPATNSITLRIDVGRDPTDLAVLNNRVFVTNQADRNLMVINTDTNTVIKTIPMGMVTTGVTVNPLTGKIYVSNQGEASISVVACATPACTYSISSANQSFAAGGGTGSVNVSAANGCNWAATSNAGFVSVTSGSSGSGNGTVAFSVAANTNTSQRTGTITIAGQTFTVTQDSLPAPDPAQRINVALASNGGVASASSAYAGYPASNVNDGSRKATNGALWIDNTYGLFPDWVEVDFSGTKTIGEIDILTQQDNYQNPVEPTSTQTFGLYGITAFDVQYWNGSAWVTIPNASVTGNNSVWRQFTFSSITTSKIRVSVNAGSDGFSRIVEVEAYAVPQPPPTNVALASNGATALASSTYGSYLPGNVIDGSRKATNGALWIDNTYGLFSDWVEVDFNGPKTINEIDVVTQQDNYTNPVEPTSIQTFGLYGITAFDVQYWNGSAWVAVPGGSVTGNNNVWRQFTFSSITTSKIRVSVNAGSDGFSRIVEVEAYQGTSAPPPPAINVALASNGGVASASSAYAGYPASNVNDGSRKATNGALWIDNTYGLFPDWLEINFGGSKTINEVDVITQQDNYQNPVEPTSTQTFGLYGITAFDVQYWNGSAWVTIPNASVTGNNNVWRQFTFSSITTSKIRVSVNAGSDGFSRIVEVEAY